PVHLRILSGSLTRATRSPDVACRTAGRYLEQTIVAHRLRVKAGHLSSLRRLCYRRRLERCPAFTRSRCATIVCSRYLPAVLHATSGDRVARVSDADTAVARGVVASG